MDRRKKRERKFLRFFTIIVKYTVVLFFSCANESYANMHESLENAFQRLGASNNVTGPGASYNDQVGGFYTAGSVFSRGKTVNANLMSLQMPHYRSGCGGIDLFMGGLSFINAQEFLHLLRNIGSNASGYAFNLALATITPQIKSVLDDLSAKVQQMTNHSITSCEAAATLVGGVWPQSDASSQLLCNAMSKDLSLATDWAQSRQRCGAGGQRDATTAQKSNLSGYRDVLGDEFNLAWKALKKNVFLSSDSRLAEFFMTISGTIVSRKNVAGNLEMREFSSKSSDGDLISALLTGGQPVQVYRCDAVGEDECLNPSVSAETLPRERSLSYKVDLLVNGIHQNLLQDKSLTSEQQAFVNSTMIPILRIMAVEMAFKAGGSPLSMSTYKDAIAHDILLQYLDDVMDLVWSSTTHLKQVQLNDKMIESFRRGISFARKDLFAKRTALFQQISLTLEAIERTQQTERKLQNQFISSVRGKE
jgi:conjugative transfer pilus assembly protein TraH